MHTPTIDMATTVRICVDDVLADCGDSEMCIVTKPISAQLVPLKNKTSRNTTKSRKYETTHRLRLPPRLHNRRPSRILIHSLHIVPQPQRQARNTQTPEYYPQRLGHSQLKP